MKRLNFSSDGQSKQKYKVITMVCITFKLDWTRDVVWSCLIT